jgi:excinuclease UvrABC ATPase subunit
MQEWGCVSFGCGGSATKPGGLCNHCIRQAEKNNVTVAALVEETKRSTIAMKYPKYYKSVSHLDEIDVYQVHKLFDIQDPSGAIQHASKKLLLSGVRTGNKTQFKDIKEARDTLNRWLEMNHTLEE